MVMKEPDQSHVRFRFILTLFILLSIAALTYFLSELSKQKAIPVELPTLEKPAPFIDDRSQRANDHIAKANVLMERAFVHEERVEKTGLQNAKEQTWQYLREELGAAVHRYQQARDENNQALELLQSLPQESSTIKLIDQRQLAQDLITKSIECHALMISFIDRIVDKDLQRLKELHTTVKTCLKERQLLEQKVTQQTQT